MTQKDLQAPFFADLGDRRLHRSWKTKVHGIVDRDAHGVAVDIQHDEDHYVVLDRKKFHLIGFHFHHPSEHWMEGRQQTMELHVVHQNINDGSYVVVGIFLDVAKKAPDNPTLLKFITQVAEILQSFPAEPDKRRISTSPEAFVPPMPEEYYRYEGSLTTPQADGTTYLETVSWVIMRNPVMMKPKQLSKLIGEFKKPARMLQPINRRFVLATFKPARTSKRR